MKEFNYVIKDPVGIHARPAGTLVAEAKKYTSVITVVSPAGKEADAKRLFGLMGLAIKCGDEITVRVDGADEEAALSGMNEVLSANL